MVRDVRQTIVEILAEHSGSLKTEFLCSPKRKSNVISFHTRFLGIENPEDYVKSLEISRRYLLDIWS